MGLGRGQKIGLWVVAGLCLLSFATSAHAAKRHKKKPLFSADNELGEKKPKLVRSIKHPWGVGLMLGDLSGLSTKYWIDDQTAWDAALGVQAGAGVGLHVDYLFHLRPFEKAPQAPLFLGAGFFAGAWKSSLGFGVRGVTGLAYHFPAPFDVFMELSPRLGFTPNFNFGMSFSIGARYYL